MPGDPATQIRTATPEDAEAIAAAEEETRRTPGLLVGHPGEIPVEAYRSKIAKLAMDGRYIVMEENGAPVGHACSTRCRCAPTRTCSR